MNVITQLSKIEKDIKSVKIQGATNVALATIEGIRLFLLNYRGSNDKRVLKHKLTNVADTLSGARENEPLARNFKKYMSAKLNDTKSVEEIKKDVLQMCEGYEAMIGEAKINFVKCGTKALRRFDVILNHCHSSSAISILKNVAKYREIEKKEFRVVVTETRPLYQGRKSAKDLVDFGVDTTMIVDSAATSFIVDDMYLPVGAVIVGCDELIVDGSFINKVGTYSIAISAQKGADKFYVATTLLKLASDKKPEDIKIEQRDPKEVWDDAPKQLKIINPSFERVSHDYVSGYITEVGVLKRKEILPRAKELYPWMF